MKTKLILLGIVVSQFAAIYFGIERIKTLKQDNRRLEYNLDNADFHIDSLRTENGELYYQYNALVLNKKEMLYSQDSLMEIIKEMGAKIRNIESVTKPKIEYIIKEIPVEVVKIDTNVYEAFYKDEHITLSERLTIDGKLNQTPIIDSLQIKLTDNLLIVREPIYKRHLILWKRLIGIKEYIKSENKYFHLDRVESYIVSSKRNKREF